MHFLHTYSQMGELITVTNAVPKKPVSEFLLGLRSNITGLNTNNTNQSQRLYISHKVP
jgi:hypothetical protein